MLKRRFKKLNNKAFTLVEIMFAVALLALASIAIGSMMISTQNSTAQMFNESELQQQVVEAQEMIHNEILATNVGIKYWTRENNDSMFKMVISDEGGEYEKLIAFYNIDTKDYVLTKKYYKWNSSEKTLWVVEIEETIPKSTTDKTILKIDENVDITLSHINKWSLVAASVENITFDLSHCENNNLISYSMSIVQDDVEYPANDVVRVRNDIYVNKVEMTIGEYHTISLKKPTLTGPILIYNGQVQGPEENDYYERFMYRVDGSVYEATKAGTYTITYRLKDPDATQWEGGGTGDITRTWTIEKRRVGLNWGTTSWVYDEEEHQTTCTLANVVQGDVCNAVLTGNKIGPQVGTKTCTASVDNENYCIDPDNNSTILEITRATPTVSIRLVDRVYNTQPQDMVAYNYVVGGSLRFYISTSNVDPHEDEVNDPTCRKTDAGTYYVWYKIVADNTGNYKDTDIIKLGEVIMDKAPGSVVAPTAKTLTYNGDPQELINAGSTPYGEIKYKVGENGVWRTTIPARTNADTYTVYYYSTGNDNYYPTNDNSSINVKIDKALPTVSIAVVNQTYNEGPQDMIEYENLVGGELKFYISTSGTTPDENQVVHEKCQATNAGTYYVWYKIIANSNNYKNTNVISLGSVQMARKAAAYVNQTNTKEYNYDGGIKNGYSDYKHVDIVGPASKSEAGNYTFYATPSDNYEWIGGGIEQRPFKWTIIGCNHSLAWSTTWGISGQHWQYCTRGCGYEAQRGTHQYKYTGGSYPSGNGEYMLHRHICAVCGQEESFSAIIG